MVIAFANNQAMTAIQGTDSVIYTDPVPLNGNDRATAFLNVHYIWASVTSSNIRYDGEVSADGVNWVAIGTFTDNTSTTTGTTPRRIVGTLSGAAFLRFKFTLSTTGASGLGGVGFDLHVEIDHA
jgi:hypothetical protein